MVRLEHDCMEAVRGRDVALIGTGWTIRCDQTFLMTDVFVRRDGRWRAVTRHVSPLEPRAV
jgi:hypothetical protein